MLYNCKHNDYLERKKKTYYSTTDMVYMLIKDENITQHIMSYIIDFEYYKQMKDVYTGVLSQLQIFNLSRYSIVPRRFHCGKDDTYNKDTMLVPYIYIHIL